MAQVHCHGGVAPPLFLVIYIKDYEGRAVWPVLLKILPSLLHINERFYYMPRNILIGADIPEFSRTQLNSVIRWIQERGEYHHCTIQCKWQLWRILIEDHIASKNPLIQ